MAQKLSIRAQLNDFETRVSGLLVRPEQAKALLLLAHGAGAGMDHRSMEAIVTECAARQIATLRYQFPYMEKGGRRPDRPRQAPSHGTGRQ